MWCSRRVGGLAGLAAVACSLGCSDAALVTDMAEAPVVAAPLVGGMPDTGHPGVVAIGITMGGMEGIGCTGTLVGPDLVMTALHCTAEVAGTVGGAFCGPVGPQFQGMFVLIGEDLKTNVTQRLDVVEIMNPCNDPCGCDIAMLRLDGFVNDPSITYAPRLEDPIVIGEEMTAVGYGKISEQVSGEGVRRFRTGVNVSCLGLQCGGLGVTNNEFGTENVACGGDSGGPIFDAQQRLAGIVSRSTIPCEAPFGLAVYGSPRTRADWVVSEAIAAAERAGHPAPAWTGAEQGPGVCEEAGRCGMNAEWDGTMSDCGACPEGQRCGFVGRCEMMNSGGGAGSGAADPMDPWFGDGSAGEGSGMPPVGSAGVTAGMAPVLPGPMMTAGKSGDDGCRVGGTGPGAAPLFALLLLVARRRRGC